MTRKSVVATAPRGCRSWMCAPSPRRCGCSTGQNFGRFRIEALLGRGGMGEVWRAFDPTRQKAVVLKLLPPELHGQPNELERLRDSFRKVHAVQHQHICPLWELLDHPVHGAYLVMKFIPRHDAGPAPRPARGPARRLAAGRGDARPAAPSPRRWTTPITRASSTATSSRRTSWWARTAAIRSSWISAWRRRFASPSRASAGRASRPLAPGRTWPRAVARPAPGR